MTYRGRDVVHDCILGSAQCSATRAQEKLTQGVSCPTPKEPSLWLCIKNQTDLSNRLCKRRHTALKLRFCGYNLFDKQQFFISELVTLPFETISKPQINVSQLHGRGQPYNAHFGFRAVVDVSFILCLLKIISRAIYVRFRDMSVFPYILCPVFRTVNKGCPRPLCYLACYFYPFLFLLERPRAFRLEKAQGSTPGSCCQRLGVAHSFQP